MSAHSVLLEGGGSGTWIGFGQPAKPSTITWTRETTLDAHGPIDSGDRLSILFDRVYGSGRYPSPDVIVAGLSIVTNKRTAEVAAAAIASAAARVYAKRPIVIVMNDILPLLNWRKLRSSAAVVCGTGTGYASRDKTGRICRASGLEYILSDEGGGYDIGQQGLRAAVRQFDHRGLETTLSGRALDYGGGTVSGLSERIYGPGPAGLKQRVAEFAVAVAECASQGDKISQSILSDAAGHLVRGVVAVTQALNSQESELYVAGSLLCSPRSVNLRECFFQKLADYPLEFNQVLLANDARLRLISLCQAVLNGSIDDAYWSNVPAAVVGR